MFAFTIGQDIDAPPARVWRALCDPAEVAQWDTGVSAALDAPPDYPQPGQHVRWRCRGGVFRTLHDRPLQVITAHTLRAHLRLGPFHFYETYTLEPRTGGCRLHVELQIRAGLPLISSFVERHYIGPRTAAAVAASLRAIKRHCEAPAASAHGAL